MKLQTIDYAPLQAMRKIDRLHIRAALNPIIVFLTTATILGMIIARSRNETADSVGTIVYIAGIVVGCSSVAWVAHVRKRQNKIWRGFADTNGWPVTPSSEAAVDIVPPSLLSAGRGRLLSDIVQTKINNTPCDIYMYEFRVGSGKSTRTFYCTVTRANLPKEFPHFILDSKRTKVVRDFSDATSKVELEGHFHKYFSLRYPPDTHIDVLSVITPDVMQTLIDSNANQDIEVCGPFVYFMVHSDHRDPDDLPTLLNSVQKLLNEFLHKAKTINYRGERYKFNNGVAATAQEYFVKTDKTTKSFWWMFYFTLVFLPIAIALVFALVAIIINR